MIENGEVDVIAATYSDQHRPVEEGRLRRTVPGRPYQGLPGPWDDTSIDTLTDLNKGKKAVFGVGSTSAQNVKAQLPSVQLQEYDSYSACVEGLRRGKVDALTTDEAILAGYSNFWGGEFKLVEMTYLKDACVTSSGKELKSRRAVLHRAVRHRPRQGRHRLAQRGQLRARRHARAS